MDNLFKDHFSNSKAPVEDTGALWQAIEAKRKQPKRRLLLWWSAGIAVLLVGAIWWAFPYFSNNKIQENNKEQVISNPAPPMASGEQKSAPANGVAAENPTENADVVTNKIHGTARPENAAEQLKKIARDEQAVTSILQTTPVNKMLESKQGMLSGHSGAHDVMTDDAKAQTKAVALVAKESARTIAHHPATAKSSGAAIQTIETQSLAMLEIPTIQLSLTGKITAAAENKNWDKCKVKEPGTFFVKAYGQAALPFENIRYRKDAPEEFPKYKERWEEKFDPFLAYSAGLQVGYTFPWQGYISAGLAYEHGQTSFETSQRVVEQITVFDEMAYFYINDVGETVWVADSVKVTNIYDRTEQHANNHKLWHIPVQLGYIATMNKFRFGGNVEMLFNVSKSYKGYFLTENGSVLEIDSANDLGYMSTSIGVSVSAGVHVGYMLGDRMELYLRPGFRFSPGSYTDDSGSNERLKVTRSFAGLRGGLMYHF